MATAIASRVTTVTNIRKRFINPHSLEKPRRSAPPRLHNEVQYEGQLRFAQPLRKLLLQGWVHKDWMGKGQGRYLYDFLVE